MIRIALPPFVVLAALVPGNLCFLHLTGPMPDFSFYQENGALENIQLLLLLLCCAVFAVRVHRTPANGRRLLLLAALLLSFTFLIRESDLRLYGAPAWLTWFTDEDGRYLLLGPLWLVLLASIVHQRRLRSWMLRRLPLSRAGLLLFLSALFLGVGVLFDKSLLRLMPSRFYEELLELNGYLVLLLVALDVRRSRPGSVLWR